MEALLGGIIIGITASGMLFFTGRVTGISGIVGGLINPSFLDKSWRLLFVLGLISGGILLRFYYPQAFENISQASLVDYSIAGFLVGVGTLMGNGCTSGHGVCGLSRFSKRSFVSTVTFIATGVLSVFLFKLIRGGL